MWIVIIIFTLIAFTIVYGQVRSAQIYRELLNTVTNENRGTKAERDLVVLLLKNGFAPENIFHDLYVKKYNGTYSQIDLVLKTNIGLIVFEVKDYSGRIFGNGNHTNWTKVLVYGKQKYKFYNPIKQNNGHIDTIRKHMCENIPIYSVIVFAGNCELRDISFVPNGTFIAKPHRVIGLINRIINDNESIDLLTEKHTFSVLKEAVENGTKENVESDHIENVRDMLGKDRVFV